jgi:hypothetical protein
VSIEEALLAVPFALRERFLSQVKAVEQRARQTTATAEELQLALGVLLALSGADAVSGLAS